MITARILIPLLFFCHFGYCQIDKTGILSLTVLEDSLHCDGMCKEVSISFKLRNNSKHDLLIYGLKRGGPYPVDMELSQFCNPIGIGTGIAFGLYGVDGRRKIHEIRFTRPNGNRRVTKADVDSVLRIMKTVFLKSGMILKSGEEMILVKELPLKDFDIDAGLQYVQIIYYSGKATPEEHELTETAGQAHATLFEGCAISDKIPLIRR